MNWFIDVAFDSINKHGEELCGDKTEIILTEDSVIIVMSDGLGSGVKANILATLTAKIAGTMLKEGASIDETVDTIVNTLPLCNVRKLAYSTFTIIQVYQDGRAYIVEYDNPPLFFFRNKQSQRVEKKKRIINDRVIFESNFVLKEGDVLTVVSDGVIHAGVGATLNLGWQWDNVNDYLKSLIRKEKCAMNISKNIIEVCKNLYVNKPGDDATTLTLKLRKPEVIDFFTGPPQEKEKDSLVIESFMRGSGKKIVAGGTASKIVARELKEKLVVEMDYIDPEVPPTAIIRGIDLVTEGVLTLNKAVDKIKRYATNNDLHNTKSYSLKGEDGASKLARMLVEDSTHLNLWVGKAVNPAHQNPGFPMDLSIKLKVVEELINLMKKLGKKVSVTYI